MPLVLVVAERQFVLLWSMRSKYVVRWARWRSKPGRADADLGLLDVHIDDMQALLLVGSAVHREHATRLRLDVLGFDGQRHDQCEPGRNRQVEREVPAM